MAVYETESSTDSDKSNLSQVFLANLKSVRQYVRGFFTCEADAEDVLHEVYLRLAERRQIDEVQHPKAFVYKVARNLSLNQRNLAAERLNESLDDVLSIEQHVQSLEMEEVMEQEQRFEHFCQAVNELPGQCRRVFILKKLKA